MVILVSPIRHVFCIVYCGMGVDCVFSLGWLVLVPGCGIDYLGILSSRDVGGVCFPILPGCRSV